MEKSKNIVHHWKKIFIEVATRAIRKSHFDYQIISFPQKDIKVDDLKKFNSGIGIEMVPEETVRDNVVNQLLQTGFWKKILIGDEERAYWTDREVYFKINDKEYYVDLAVERFEFNQGSPIEHSPTLIELKRLNTKQVDLKSNPSFKDGQSTKNQLAQIDKDIEKLKTIRKAIQEKEVSNRPTANDDAIIAILTWGVIGSTEKTELFAKFGLPNDYSEVKYFPTEWNDEGDEVLKWCIVVLTEIDNTEFNSK